VANLSYISSRAAVGPSPIHGRGLFATAPIAKGEIVCITMPGWFRAAEVQIAEGAFIARFV
jgi:hypothetical protein